MKRFIACFLCIWSFAMGMQATDIENITILTERNGLSQNTVRDLMQDSQGFMWFCTINGLNRYDGKNFLNIYPALNNGAIHSDCRIREAVEDKHGFIWVLTYSETMYCYDPRLEQMVDFAPTDADKSYKNLLMDSSGDVWLWGSQGCLKVSIENGRPVGRKPGIEVLAEGKIQFVYEEKSSCIWIGTNEAIYQLMNGKITKVREGGPFWEAKQLSDGRTLFICADGICLYSPTDTSFHLYPSKSTIQNGHCAILDDRICLLTSRSQPQLLDLKTGKWLDVKNFFQGNDMDGAQFLVDNRGQVWVYNQTGVLWRHRPNHVFEPLHLIPPEQLRLISNERYTVYHDSRDIIWISTFGNGLFALNEKDGTLEHYTAGRDLPTNYLFRVIEDRSGEIWVGTELGGVVKISLSNYPLEIIRPAADKNNVERSNAVRMIYEDTAGCYWLGTRDGRLHIYAPDMQKRYEHRLSHSLPLTLVEDTLGRKWLGTKGEGLYIFTPSGDRILEKHMLVKNGKINEAYNNIYNIIRDDQNRIWLATFGNGLFLTRRDETGEIAFDHFTFGDIHLNSLRVIVQDRKGHMWLGTNNGIVFFNPDELIKDTTRFSVLHIHNDEGNSFMSEEVKELYEDREGRIWAATTGGGLNLFKPGRNGEDPDFIHYGKDRGLSNQMIQAITEDDTGNLWISTENGISKFNPSDERFENFMLSNPHHPIVFNDNACLQTHDGQLMFGSFNGAYRFAPENLLPHTIISPVLITGLRIDGLSMSPSLPDSPLQRSVTYTRKLVLDSSQRSFDIEYALPDYHTPELNQYAYYLDGYETSWNMTIGNNRASYRQVPPGDYTFRVKGCNSFGQWTKEETTLRVCILSPWWVSWWAITGYSVVGLVIMWIVFRTVRNVQRLRMAVVVEKQLTEYKLRFFTNISHEFRTPLTIIRGVIEDLAASKEVAPLIGKRLKLLVKSSTRLMRLINQLLEFRRLQNDKLTLNVQYISAKSFFYDIYQSFTEIAAQRSIDYTFNANFTTEKLLLDRDKMDKVTYNLLSNAFKHTPDGGKICLRLEILQARDKLVLNVSDSGEGVPPDKRKLLFVRFEQVNYHAGGIGIGLHLVAELVKVHKGDVAYRDSEWGGACFVVTLPLGADHYAATDIVESSPEEPTNRIVIDWPQTEELPPIESSGNHPYKIMVIEDDADVRELIAMQLEKHFTVVSSANGAEAMHVLSDESPDLIVCDLMMPEMDGLTFTRRLKSDFAVSHIPVILLTAYSTDEFRIKGIQAGADSYITKPFSMKYLLTRILKLIEARATLRQKFASEPGLSKPLSIPMTDFDKVFLEKVHALIEHHLGDADFKLNDYISDFGIGRTTFFNKVKSIAGCSPSEYIRVIRMKKAAELLVTTEDNVAEIGYKIGINDPAYFSRCFKQTFGKSPLQYRKDNF